MPWLRDVRYSREETIAAVRDYYRFLVQMYMPAAYIIEPPPEGWPSITKEKFRNMGKTDEVIELLRHLPYIRDDYSPRGPAGFPRGALINYSTWDPSVWANGYVKDVGNRMSEGQICRDVPPHVVGLIESRPVGDTLSGDFKLLLDTELGIIHWNHHPTEIVTDPSREPILDRMLNYCDNVKDEEDLAWLARRPCWGWNEAIWRDAATAWPVVDFFELLKDEFRALRFIPISP